MSGLVVRGSTDDWEQEVARGKLTFYSNAFRVDSVYRHVTRRGTSDFKGQEFTLSGLLYGRSVQVGVVLKPPVTFTRTFSQGVTTDTGDRQEVQTLRGEDRMRLPWRGWIGMVLQPRSDLRLGIAYELRPYGSARYTDAQGNTSRPWTSANLLRVASKWRRPPGCVCGVDCGARPKCSCPRAHLLRTTRSPARSTAPASGSYRRASVSIWLTNTPT
ncbi:hypothetical protein [Rhodothermus marinus]|uniref:hypothetical protein n=1 Tax=Rhodothermus marinus TaxID=29549 RepID=UPI000A91C883|nr:hypothetical protein [Rhodothermus marinus]